MAQEQEHLAQAYRHIAELKSHILRQRVMLKYVRISAGFIAPCLPTKTDKLPSGDLWLHEIKHDGFRVIARKDGDRVRLYSRPGNDLTGASSFQRPRNPPLLPPSKR